MLFPQLLLLATAAFLWGSAYVFIGMALKGFLPVTIVFLRCVLASVALLGLILAQGGSARRALTDLRRRPGLALLLAVSVMTAPSLLITFAQQRVRARGDWRAGRGDADFCRPLRALAGQE